MIVYILVFDRDRKSEEYEGNDYEIIGVFYDKENAIKVMNEKVKEWHFSSHITSDDYIIEEFEVK